MMSAVTFAADLETAVTADDALQEVAEVNTEKVSFDRNSGSVEIVITAEGIDGDGNFCIKTPRTNMTLSGGIIEDCNMKSDSKKLPSIAVYGYAKKNSWKGSTLEISIGCEATGKIKTYKGTCTVYKADGITK